jgi:5'-phosphate synthase pdxT subunit
VSARFGVLALQGDFAAHRALLAAAGADAREVRRTSELEGLRGLVLPGGESTALLKLMADDDWFGALRAFRDRGAALLGTCAGAILLASRVEAPRQPSLGLLDATVARNGYGRQLDSFEADVDAPALGGRPLKAAFIRAPRFTATGAAASVLGRIGEEPVLLRQGRVLAATFHPELFGDDRLHRLFLALAA